MSTVSQAAKERPQYKTMARLGYWMHIDVCVEYIGSTDDHFDNYSATFNAVGKFGGVGHVGYGLYALNRETGKVADEDWSNLYPDLAAITAGVEDYLDRTDCEDGGADHWLSEPPKHRLCQVARVQPSRKKPI